MESELTNFMNSLFDFLEDIPPETHEKYLQNLPKYKEIIDRTPNKFLDFHLDDSIKKERYELAEYIKQTAIKRNFILTKHQ